MKPRHDLPFYADRITAAKTAFLIEQWASFGLCLDDPELVRAVYIPREPGYSPEWHVVAHYDGHHHLWHADFGGGMPRLREVPARRDELCADCSEILGKGAEWEPDDAIAYEYGSIRGRLEIPGEWSGCEHCIAHRRGEAA